jgi:hypothetical protein
VTLDHVVSQPEAGEGSRQGVPGPSGRDLTSTFRTLCDRHAFILLRPPQTRNSGLAEQCLVIQRQWRWNSGARGSRLSAKMTFFFFALATSASTFAVVPPDWQERNPHRALWCRHHARPETAWFVRPRLPSVHFLWRIIRRKGDTPAWGLFSLRRLRLPDYELRRIQDRSDALAVDDLTGAHHFQDF